MVLPLVERSMQQSDQIKPTVLLSTVVYDKPNRYEIDSINIPGMAELLNDELI